MKKTIIFNKGGLDAIATARNIIMELYSALKKWRLGSLRTPPPELIGNVLKNGALMLSPLRGLRKALDLSVCLADNSQVQIKKGH